ncbi:hypothetical protein V8F33_002458 [Rhypophila sp. PSN 637]
MAPHLPGSTFSGRPPLHQSPPSTTSFVFQMLLNIYSSPEEESNSSLCPWGTLISSTISLSSYCCSSLSLLHYSLCQSIEFLHLGYCPQPVQIDADALLFSLAERAKSSSTSALVDQSKGSVAINPPPSNISSSHHFFKPVCTNTTQHTQIQISKTPALFLITALLHFHSASLLLSFQHERHRQSSLFLPLRLAFFKPLHSPSLSRSRRHKLCVRASAFMHHHFSQRTRHTAPVALDQDLTAHQRPLKSSHSTWLPISIANQFTVLTGTHTSSQPWQSILELPECQPPVMTQTSYYPDAKTTPRSRPLGWFFGGVLFSQSAASPALQIFGLPLSLSICDSLAISEQHRWFISGPIAGPENRVRKAM